MSNKEYYGTSWLRLEDEKVPIKAVEFDVSELSTQETYGIEMSECDICGGKVHPSRLLYVASTNGEKSGKYHLSCWDD